MDVSLHLHRTTPVVDAVSPRRRSARQDIARGLMQLLADAFALYLKTKDTARHASKSRFSDCGVQLAAQADQRFATADAIAERVRRLGAARLPSIGQLAGLRRVLDGNNTGRRSAADRVSALRDENADLVRRMRELRAVCERHDDVGTADLLGTWITQAHMRASDRASRGCIA